MQHLPIWYLGKIQDEICDSAKNELCEMQMQDAAMGIDGDVKIEKQRNTDVVFAPFDFWLRQRPQQL